MKKITFLIYAFIFCFSSWTYGQYLNEGFETSVPPAGWTANITNTGGPTLTWGQAANPHTGSYSAQVEYDPALVPQNEDLISPVLDLTTATNPRLRFWFNMSYYWAVDPNDNYDFNVSITDGTTTTPLWSEADFGVFTNWVWYEITLDLSAYAGTNNMQLVFNYTGVDGASLTLDDVLVEETPTCLPVTDLAASVTYTSANLSWTDPNGATAWNIELGAAGFTPTQTPTETGVSNPHTVGSLTANTAYEYYVQADCATDGTSTWAGPFEFYTGYCTSVPTSIDGNGLGDIVLGATTFNSSGDVTYEDYTATTVDLGQGVTTNLMITYQTGYTYETYVWIDFNDNLVFDSSELVYSGTSLADNPTTLDASFVMPISAPLGTHRMRIGTSDFGQTPPDPCYSGGWGVTADFNVNIVTPACSPPVATAAVNADCDNLQYYVDVNVTDLGDGTPIITDGTSTWTVSGLGVTQAGPFADGTTVTLTLEHGSDGVCDLPLGTFSNYCPTECAEEPIWPTNGETGVDPFGTITMTWTAPSTGITPTSYNIYIGFMPDGSDLFLFDNTVDTFFEATVGATDSTIYWSIVPLNGTTEATGCALWSFTSGPAPGYCLTADWGQYPGSTFTPSTCDGTTPNDIVTDGWGGEYSVVAVTSGVTYQFNSSIATDVITISADGGATVAAYGVGSVTWTATTTGTVNFYTHPDDQCGSDTVGRTRSVLCGGDLSVEDYAISNMLTYYPNPVVNTLTLNGVKTIQDVAVYNMLGQEVLRTKPNTVQAEIEMSHLQAGTYFVKVTVENSNKTIKVVKK
jgi:hypothetical protein